MSKVIIHGSVVKPQYVDHRIFGDSVYAIRVQVNGYEVKVILPNGLEIDQLKEGDPVNVIGEIRSRCEMDGGFTLYVYSREINQGMTQVESGVQLQGALMRLPHYDRRTKVYKAFVAVQRPYRHSDIIPIIVDKDMAKNLLGRPIGAVIFIKGTLGDNHIIVENLATHYKEALQAGG